MVCLGNEQRSSVVCEIASKYCILDCFVDYDGYSIFSKGFLPTVVDTLVIWIKNLPILVHFSSLSLRQNYDGVMAVMVTSFQRIYASTCSSQDCCSPCPNLVAGHGWPTPPLEAPIHSLEKMSACPSTPLCGHILEPQASYPQACHPIRGQTEWKPQSQKTNQTDHNLV